jgi:hypothetical protein
MASHVTWVPRVRMLATRRLSQAIKVDERVETEWWVRVRRAVKRRVSGRLPILIRTKMLKVAYLRVLVLPI